MAIFTPEFKKTAAKGKTFGAYAFGYVLGGLHAVAIFKGWI